MSRNSTAIPVPPGRTSAHAVDFRTGSRHAFSATVRLSGYNGEEFEAVDLSVEGISLISPRPLEAGRTVDVTFLDGSIVVRGKIRNEREVYLMRWRVGIQFLQPQPELLEVALSVTGSEG